MNVVMRSAASKLFTLAEHVRRVDRVEILNTSHESFTWREVLALDELIHELAEKQCHDQHCPVHSKGPASTGNTP